MIVLNSSRSTNATAFVRPCDRAGAQRRFELFGKKLPVGKTRQSVVRCFIAQLRVTCLEQTPPLDFRCVRARVCEREPDQVDEELHRAQRLARGNRAVFRAVDAHVAEHPAEPVTQHERQRVALVPLFRCLTRRIHRQIARIDRARPLRVGFCGDEIARFKDFEFAFENRANLIAPNTFADALRPSRFSGQPCMTRRCIGAEASSAATIVTYLKLEQITDRGSNRIEPAVEIFSFENIARYGKEPRQRCLERN